ncbi:MAG: isoprenylcysteine carboxylmethyltransferase family protein [Candidatus Aminicenantales bacterium]
MKFEAPPWLRYAAGAVFMGGLLFLSSGRLDYWRGWVYLLVNLIFVALTARALRNDAGLVSERLHPGKGMKWWDKGYFLVSTPLYVAALLVAGIDAGRLHRSPKPEMTLYAVGLVLYVSGQGLYLWAKKANPFFSSVVRIQTERGQMVCREGPYRLCRHPGYLGGLLFGLSTPIILGSYWALIPQGLAAVLLVGRTFLEDRMLTKDLLWYREYAQTVRSRLFPGVW